jgi:hypothetical protein
MNIDFETLAIAAITANIKEGFLGALASAFEENNGVIPESLKAELSPYFEDATA